MIKIQIYDRYLKQWVDYDSEDPKLLNDIYLNLTIFGETPLRIVLKDQ